MIRVGEAPSVERVEQENPAPVEHWYSVESAELSDLGFDAPALCGAWGGSVEWDGNPVGLTPGETILRAEPNDCVACIRVLQDHVIDGFEQQG